MPSGLKTPVRETSARYSALESHFLDTQTDLENHRILNRNLEISSTELKSEITRIRHELKIATSELKSDRAGQTGACKARNHSGITKGIRQSG